MPSAPVIGVCIAFAVGAFLVLRPAPGPEETELTKALAQTLDEGVHYDAVNKAATSTVTGPDSHYEGDVPAGAEIDTLAYPMSVMNPINGAPDVDVVGSEAIGPVLTTHFVASVDPEWWVKEDSEVIPGFKKTYGQAMVELQARPTQLNVWVDGVGIIRRFVESEELKNGSTVSTTIDLTTP